jgi:pimeloyl-ACP methyl ester carboxylesterase
MPFADNQEVRIHYEVEGDGPPLVLQHGFSDSLQTWYDLGYVDSLKPDYRLILVDARGHGASDKPHDPEACRPECYAGDVVAVLADLEISRAHFFGYSMGGWIAFAMAQYAPEHVHALIIGGANPNPPVPPDPMLQALQQAGVEAIPALWGVPLQPSLKARLLANDAQALIANRIQRLATPSFAEVIPRMTMPCLVYAGEADPVYSANKEFVARMPNATFFSLPDLNHPEAFFRSDLVLPHVRQFLQTLNR